MPHDVFISYSRADSKFCDLVDAFLGSCDYTVFVDRRMPGGVPWGDALKATLGRDESPEVLLLASDAAVANPGYIRKELALARKHKLAIIPVELDPGAAFRFVNRRFQAIRAERMPGDVALHPLLMRDLRWSLHARIRRGLEKRRRGAEAWARSVLAGHEEDYWADSWRKEFDPADRKSRALTGPGGVGKSVILARAVLELAAAGSNFPILVGADELADDASKLVRSLECGSAAALPEALAEFERRHGERVWFFVDGLERMTAQSGLGLAEVNRALTVLSSGAPTIVSCRRQVWDEAHASRVALPRTVLARLPSARVREIVATKLPGAPADLGLLSFPFFLSAVLDQPRRWERLLASESQFVRGMLNGIADSGRTGMPDSLQREALLDALTACQATSLEFEVRLDDVRAAAKSVSRWEETLADLRSASALDVGNRGSVPTLRRRHDLLDAYALALHFAVGDGVADLLRRVERGCGWMVASALVQMAHDESQTARVETAFEGVLRILDLKKFRSPSEPPTVKRTVAMDRAWAATYLLTERFETLLPLSLKALSGEFAEPLDVGDAGDVQRVASRLRPEAAVTQEALSTLASAFRAREFAPHDDARAVLPVLERKLNDPRFELKARIVEAIGKFDDPAAMRILVRFGRATLAKIAEMRPADAADAAKALEYVARAAAPYGPEEAVIDLLRNVAAAPNATSRGRWIARDRLKRLRPFEDIEVVEPSDEDLASWVAAKDVKGRYSDWSEVQEGAELIRARLADGRPVGSATLSKLVLALHHEHTYVRRPVAEALALVDAPGALDALVAELLGENVPPAVSEACLDAVRRQLARAKDGRRDEIVAVVTRAVETLRGQGSNALADSLLAATR